MSFDHIILCILLFHSLAVREGITDSLKRAFSDSKVKCVVICGSNGVFCGGMDTFAGSIVSFISCYPLLLDSGFHRNAGKNWSHAMLHFTTVFSTVLHVRTFLKQPVCREERELQMFCSIYCYLSCSDETGVGMAQEDSFYLIQVQRTSID